jgi:hypothetical protein
MTRTKVLSDAILRDPHPKYGKLTRGRFTLIQKYACGLEDDDLANGIAWVICSRHHRAPEIVTAFASEDPVSALRDIFEAEMHALEYEPFMEWFNAEIGATDAASTTAKEETGPGKSGAEHQPVTPTS